jgi:trk system potassium uptake protein TrkA
MIAKMICDVMPSDGMRLFSIFESGDVTFAELEIQEGSPAAGARVAALRLPPECVLIAVVRAGAVEFPRGATELSAGDKVFALSRAGSLDALKRALMGA